MKKTILLSFIASTLASLCFCSAQELAGTWQGVLQFPSAKLRIVLNLKQENNLWTATLESPDQSKELIPVPEIRLDEDSLFFAIPKLQNLTYRGLYDGEKIAGLFSQENYSTHKPITLELTFIRRNKQQTNTRPQEPQAPYPYTTQEVEIHDEKTKIQLAGTLTIPKKEKPAQAPRGYPAILLITGSGPQNRDEEIAGHKPFLLLADHLTRNGFAVLRYDDRGVGHSTGTFAGATTFDFATDARAAIAYLRRHPLIAPQRIALLGHSEGGLIAQIIAADDRQIAAIAMLAAPSIRGDSILLLQTSALLQKQGLPSPLIEEYRQINRSLYALATDKNLDSIALYNRAKEILEASLQKQKVPQTMQQEIMTPILAQITDQWARCFITLDPALYLRDIHCPVLALYGSKDLQVLAEPNESALKKILRKKTLKQSAIHTFPRLNHLFQRADTGLPSEYSTIKETIAPEALSFLSNELLKRLSLRSSN